jgi:hypothetical protein
MAKNNDVFSIIPIQANTAVIAAGQQKLDLLSAPDQVGIFDYETGLSIDVAGAANVKKFFIAMSVDTDGDGVADDVIETAGTHVQAKNVTSYLAKCLATEQPQIVDVKNFTASCDTQYALKVEFNNDEKYMNYGFNQLTKTFVVKTSCCDGCETCPTGDCAELASLMVAEINNDDDNLVLASAVANTGNITILGAPTGAGTATVTLDGTDVFDITIVGTETQAEVAVKIASAIDASSKYIANADGNKVYIGLKDGSTLSAPLTNAFADGGTGITAGTSVIATTEITDFALFSSQFPGVCPTIKLTTVPSKVKQYCDVNTQYYHLRMPVLTVSFAQSNTTSLGFDCNGTIETVQDVIYPEGFGYDLANIEYKAGGFEGKPGPYRTGDMIGVAFKGFSNLVSKTTFYNKVDLTYDLESNSGWLDYKNNLNTSIVFPCGFTTASDSVLEILDALLSDFPALEATVNGCSTVPCP